jgi:predicted nucleic-acid-binding Zn-ribbon protein
MRDHHTCPKCRGRKFIVVDRVMQADHDSINGTHALLVTADWVPTGESGLFGEKHERRSLGTFEAWVCAKCSFTEWYAHINPRALETLAKNRSARIVEAEEREPYR